MNKIFSRGPSDQTFTNTKNTTITYNIKSDEHSICLEMVQTLYKTTYLISEQHNEGLCYSKGPFTKHKFSHQTKHFCCSSAFLLHQSSVLVPLKPQTFETGFQSRVSWHCNRLHGCVNCQAECLWMRWPR